MENPPTILLVLALLCVSVVAATRTKLQSINNLDVVGICKSMVETQGYTCQEHQVTTEDGYILGLQRIPKGRSGNEIADRQPVLLQHGGLLDASSWLLNPPDQSLAFILADNGFDVWLANFRGTKSSRGHTSLSPDDDPIFCSSQNPNRQIQQLVEFICTTRGIDCSNLLAAIGGPNCCLNFSNIDALVEHDPQPTATKNLIHLSQIVRKGTVEMYDYGLEDTNIKHYKKPTPPVYNMANIPKDVPLFFSYGGRDSIADINDVGILLDKLRDHDRDKLVVQYREEYAHVDFIMSVNANQDVYGPLLAFFRLH
ncbi:triacylglycerol lipase 2-like [Prunus avium]|uniref:Triacylglycerol lipase 2-like n=1 Tax=Prunus avium TaxID=42229 RepID=A0A6P5RGV7_PRUAV|nr:triacylglycerol lipase 2-like [Prunus avium]